MSCKFVSVESAPIIILLTKVLGSADVGAVVDEYSPMNSLLLLATLVVIKRPIKWKPPDVVRDVDL